MMARTFKIPTIACGLFLTCCVSPLVAQESRIWTDSTGKHQLRAKLIDVVDGKARLERPNGDISRIPLDKLSKEDQEYIRSNPATSAEQPVVSTQPGALVVQGLQIGDRVEAQHFHKWQLGTVVEIDYKWNHIKVKIDGNNHPGWTVDIDEIRYPGTNQQPVLIKPATPESSLKTIRPNYDDMDQLMADGKPKDHVAADPLPSVTTKWQPRSVRLAGTQDFFESPSDFEIAPGGQPVAMIVYENRHHRDEVFPRVDLLDMQKRKVVASGPAPRGTGQLAMSPSGTHVVTLPGEHPDSDDNGQLNFWKIAGAKIEHWISFAPYVMNTWPNAVPSWSMWLDENRLFTVNNEGQLILWDVSKAKALYELLVERGVNPILSPGRKYLVIPTNSGIQFFDAATGKYLAIIGTENFRTAALAFSPSGRQLALATNGFIDIVDITTGQTTRSFPCENAAGISELGWIDEDYLFTNRGHLIHVSLRLIAWNFELTPDVVVRPFGGTFWVLLQNRSNGSQVLTPLELPPREAIDAVKGLDENELLAVRPGEAVTIDVQIPEDNLLSEDVRTALHAALVQAGMKVAENQQLQLVARMTHGETTQVNYRAFHTFRDAGQTLSVTSRVYDLELLLEGIVIWRRKATHSAPHILHMESGETTEDAVARVMKPTAANFSGRLPAYVVRPEFLEPLGTSRLTLSF
jgi:hypothetical protein